MIQTECHYLKKGGYVMIGNHPCKIIGISVSSTGKHGHAKIKIDAIDIFTGYFFQQVYPGHICMEVPPVSEIEYKVINFEEICENKVCLIIRNEANKDAKIIMTKKEGSESTQAKQTQIIQKLKEGEKDLVVKVLKYDGKEQVVDWIGN